MVQLFFVVNDSIPKLENSISLFPLPRVKAAFRVGREYGSVVHQPLLPAVHQHTGSWRLLLMTFMTEDWTRSCTIVQRVGVVWEELTDTL